MSDQCKSCKAPVVWAKSLLGKPVIFDAMPAAWLSKGYRIIDGVATFVTVDPSMGEELFTSHWATCPNSKTHRAAAAAKKRKTQPEEQWGKCIVCKNHLPIVADTGMCGPCCTGEADTLP